jgi:Zn-dependent protease with chaperone function
MFRKKYFLFSGFLILGILLIEVLIPSVCFSDLITRQVKKEVEKRILDNEITIIPQLNKLTTGFGRVRSGEFYFVKTKSKIFFQDKNVSVKVTAISFEDDGVLFELWNDILGAGKIQMFFSEQGSPQLNADEIEESLKLSLSNKQNQKVVVNTKTRIFHLHTCNHLPEPSDMEEMSMSDATSKGNKPCGYCFVRMFYLPDFGIESYLARQGAASLRYKSPIVMDLHLQDYIQEVGNKVLKKWPLPLIGYAYRFQVIEDGDTNALAFPGGHIMLTSGLLNSVENEEELEAVLAHEIAHVERRHLLRKHYMDLESQQAQAVLMAIGTSAVGVAAADNNRSAATAMMGVTLLGALALDVYYSGYPKEQERDADDLAILYFDQNGMDKKNLENVFRKFEFRNLATVHNPDPASLTHPYLEERIVRIWQNEFQTFNNKHFIYTASNRPSVQLDLLYQTILGKHSSLSVYINDYALIDKMPVYGYQAYLTIKDEKGTKRFDFDKRDIVRDTWGAYLLFKGKDSDVVRNDVEDVSLVIEKETNDITEIVESPQNSMLYNFKEGVITY